MKKLIEASYPDFLQDLETIVNIDSGSDHPAGIRRIAKFFQERFDALGLETELRTLKNGLPGLEARSVNPRRPFDLMLLGHMDTVFPKGEVKKRPFTIAGDKALGPGVCDMKGGLLVVLYLLEILKQTGILDDLAIAVCFNGDEETGSYGSRDWISSVARNSTRAFVFEPCRPGHHFVLQRKGGGWFKVTAHGTSAHAGAEPQKGANAVIEIAHQILAIEALNQSGPDTTTQATVIAGGDKINIIPNLASTTVDVRIPNLSEMRRVEDFFAALPQNTHLPGIHITVSGGVDRPPMEPDGKAMALWKQIESTANAIGLSVSYLSTGGCSDGNFTSAAGVATIDGMGPVGSNAHRPDEYIELDSICPQILLIASLCRDLAGGT